MNDISGKNLLKILLFKLFTSDILNAIINIILPIIISIRCTDYSNDTNWWLSTIIIIIIIIIFNIISVILKNIQEKQNKNLNIIYKCYNDQSTINKKAATKIYRLNKSINGYIKDGTPINKKVFDKIADFQTLSFIVCESIRNMLVTEYGKDIKCEVTLMKNDSGNIKMLSYSNDDNKIPSSYTKNFNYDDIDIYFVKLFKDLNAEITCLPNKKSVNDNFKKIKGSEKREDQICQYIGIPIKTDRNEIELLLQIDVSKNNVFGKNKEQVLSFAKNILYPYATLLHKSYERDLIFSQYYDMITSMLSKLDNRS